MSPTQTSIDAKKWMEYQPIVYLDSGDPIEFLLPGSGETYLNVVNTFLFVVAKISKGNGTDLDLDNAVGLFRNRCSVKLTST